MKKRIAPIKAGPAEPTDQEAAAFYGKLLRMLKDTDTFRNGDWSQIDPLPAWSGNWSSEGFVSYAWAGEDEGRYVVVINYADNQGQCYLRLPFPELQERQMLLSDLMGGEVHYRYPRGPDWMPITPKTGSLFHAE